MPVPRRRMASQRVRIFRNIGVLYRVDGSIDDDVAHVDALWA